MSFVDRHGLWTADQRTAARALADEVKRRGLEVVRFSFPDQHGILRGKTVTAAEVGTALENGVTITTTLFAKDTSHRTVFPVFTPGGGFGLDGMEGGADALMVADPATFRVLPWAPHSGWVLCDVYFQNGEPVPFATRRILRSTLERVAAAGFEYLAGLEVEFHVFRVVDPHLRPADAGQPGEPPEVQLLTAGYQYLTEVRYDLIDPVAELLRRDLAALGLPLRSLEVEYGPSQVEFTLGPLPGLASADAMVLFRSAVKQICRRHGYHATFMCRPRIPNVMSSGWHLHQSLRRLADGGNAFMPAKPGEWLSETGRRFLAGLLAHAGGAAALATPTINGYKRYRPYSLAPDRAIWGRENRGAMVRVVGGAGRSGNAAREPDRRASGEPLSLLRVADLRRPRRPGAEARSGTLGGHPLRDRGRAAAALARRGARGLARGRLPAGGSGRRIRGLLLPPQGGGARALQSRGHRVGAPRVLRDLLMPGR